jgi:two-component system nitrate/nitrite response regulator NarL
MEAVDQVGTIIITEHTLTRVGMTAFFSESRFAIRRDVSSIAKAIELADTQAELVFIASGLDDEILEPLKTLRIIYPRSRIVLYAHLVQLPPERLFEVFGTSVDGCLMSDAPTRVLRQSLDLIMMGEHVFPFSLLLNSFPSETEAGERPRINGQMFSERERQVLNFLREGRSNKFIARELQLSEATVKIHIGTLVRKIGCTNRTQAAIWITKQGATWGDEDLREHAEVKTHAPVLPTLLSGSISAT